MKKLQEILDSTAIKIEQTVDVESFNRAIARGAKPGRKFKLDVSQNVKISSDRVVTEPGSSVVTVKELLWEIMDALPDGTNRLKLFEEMVIAIVFERLRFQNLTAEYLGITPRRINYIINGSSELRNLKPCDKRTYKPELLRLSHEGNR